jgi:parallel beta-helix repeat protein
MFVSRSSGFGSGSGKVSIQDFHFTRNGQNGLWYDCSADIDSCSFSKNIGNGVTGVGRKEFKGHVTLLKRVISSGNGGNGIDLDTDNDDVTMEVFIRDSVCSGNDGNGVHLATNSSTAKVALALTGMCSTRNSLHGMLIVPVAMDKGLRLSADRCSFSSNGETGITVNEEGLESCVVLNTESSGNGSSGMVLVCDSVHLESNTASHNTGSGISVSSSSGGVVRDNSCSSNTERGITISTSHVEYASNRCVSNGLFGIEVAGGLANVLRDNFVSGNADAGIVLHTSGNRVYENRAGVQTNPLFEPNPGVVNDKSFPRDAVTGGAPNIGF